MYVIDVIRLYDKYNKTIYIYMFTSIYVYYVYMIHIIQIYIWYTCFRYNTIHPKVSRKPSLHTMDIATSQEAQKLHNLAQKAEEQFMGRNSPSRSMGSLMSMFNTSLEYQSY